MSTKPFHRLSGVKVLTWDKCFTLDRAGIKTEFIDAIVKNALGTSDNPTRKLAALLLAMTNEASTQPQSIALIKGHGGFVGSSYPSIVPLQSEIETSDLGRVGWSPKGSSLKLWCHSVFDLLGACMSDAAWIPSSEQAQKDRTKSNYFARLASLYSYWCFRLIEGNNSDRRPAMTGIAYTGDVILLGCSIPAVPGKVTPSTSSTTGKEIIRRSRFADLQTRGRQEGSNKQILDLNKVKQLAQSYGNCAETWAFNLLCLQNESSLKDVHGVAVKIPASNVVTYDEKTERTEQRYEQLCGNCRRLITQIALWGSAKDSVVKNFNVIEWTLK